jgi:VIT1/CCC1 family predicted Fe2+/Mn2+ transporter
MIYAIASAFFIGVIGVILGWITNNEKWWMISRIFGGAFIVLLIIQIIISR